MFLALKSKYDAMKDILGSKDDVLKDKLLVTKFFVCSG